MTVGEAFEDLIFVNLDRLPRPGEEVKTSQFLATYGGGAVITAVASARLGLKTAIVSGLSAGAAAFLKKEGIAVTNLRKPDEPHAISAALSTKANRSFVTFNGINDVLEPRLFEAVKVLQARHVHFAFYPHDCGRWESVVTSLRAAGRTTSWDFGWNEGLLGDRRFPGLLAALDYVFFNEQEATMYARRLSLDAAVDVWRNHPHAVVLKLGPKGSRLVTPAADVSATARKVKTVDTTGAGDAFNAGFLCATLASHSHKAALRLGNFVGAMSTRAAGGLSALPYRKDVDKGLL